MSSEEDVARDRDGAEERQRQRDRGQGREPCGFHERTSASDAGTSRRSSRNARLREAVKADTLSLVAWQIGMYGWMALATFELFGHEFHKSSRVFWFMMQIAMCCCRR